MTFGVEHVSYRYAGAARRALDDVTLTVGDGTFYGVIGPNGSGKSTLLRVLLGLLAPEAGDVRLDGKSVQRWTRRDLARRVGVVTQDEEMIFPVDVRSLVSMGRYPHLGPFQPLRRSDHEAIERAMARCEVTEFGARLVSTLSGGERQRARLARALAQEPVSYALDEPTAALDIAHEMTMFELLARLVREDHATVLVVTHNLNLAARYADRLLLLDRGRVAAEGSPGEVLTRDRIERVWGWPVRIAAHPGPGRDSGAPQVVPLAADNEPAIDLTPPTQEGTPHA
jgi:iron complex transport system ATP-binding protein